MYLTRYCIHYREIDHFPIILFTSTDCLLCSDEVLPAYSNAKGIVGFRADFFEKV